MRTLFGGASADALRSAAEISVLSLRVKGPQTLLIYRDGKETPTVIPMVREGGEWKADAVFGSALPL
jgi:hypothetical protein